MTYFQDLFKEKNVIQGDATIPNFFPTLDPIELDALNNEVTEAEIKNSLFSIGGLKAPGPDGIPAKKFQTHWSTCKDDIIQLVKDCFTTSELPSNLNNTLIALIPKVTSPLLMKQMRPISLCNTLYKVI